MFSLATIQRMNAAVERRKLQRRARAMNAKAKKVKAEADAATNRYLQDNDQ